MLSISLQLQQIAADLGAEFIRSDSLSQSNIQVHYKDLIKPVVIYVGHGAQDNYYEGAEPLQKVNVQIYILVKKNDIDQLAWLTDIQLFKTKQMAGNIMYQFESPRDNLTFKTEPVSILDDQLIGHELNAQLIVEGNACKKITPIIINKTIYGDTILDENNSKVRFRYIPDDGFLWLEVGTKINIKSLEKNPLLDGEQVIFTSNPTNNNFTIELNWNDNLASIGGHILDLT